MRTPPFGSSVTVTVPVTADPLLDSSVAFADGPSGALAEAQPAQISAATAKHARAVLPIVFMNPPLLRGSYFESPGPGPGRFRGSQVIEMPFRPEKGRSMKTHRRTFLAALGQQPPMIEEARGAFYWFLRRKFRAV